MLKALYYPHTEVENPIILKNALLLWDEMETIVPSGSWHPTNPPLDKTMREASDLIVRRRVPNEAEKRSAHAALLESFNEGELGRLLLAAPTSWGRKRYLVYPDKFTDETWRMLERGGMARWIRHEKDYGVPAVVGFLMMSMLADTCAGSQIQRVTDRVQAYNWLGENRARLLDSQYVTGLDISQVAPAYDRLVSLSLEVLDGRNISLKKLISLRKKELRQGGTDYAAMRRRYLTSLQTYLKRIGKEGKSASDLREIERQFKQEIKKDLTELAAELGTAGRKALLSKEIVLSALIVGGTLVSPIFGMTTLGTELGGIGVVPLAGAANDYRGKRREILQKHQTSWLYLGTRRGMSIY